MSSKESPQAFVETLLYPEKMIVWYALLVGGVIGLYVFKNADGQNVTVNGDRDIRDIRPQIL